MSDPDDLVAARAEHRRIGIDTDDLAGDPLTQFRRWYDHWRSFGGFNSDAVVLATADRSGRPSARWVLLKGIDDGFVFYTNRQSRKGDELAAQPVAALCFGWIEIERQVRVEGPVTAIADEESDAYFASRARGSQIAAWASDQSRPIDSRADLEARVAEVEARFDGGDIPRPAHWGGYRLVPEQVEFWQSRDDRLHDRFRYRRSDGAPSGWLVERLAP